MALLQTQFMKFDDAIRLGWSDDQGILRDKRDAAPGQTFTRELAGCGNAFTPYSSLDALRTAELAARLAVDVLRGDIHGSLLRSWKGRPEAFRREGYRTSPRFELAAETLESGVELEAPQCRVCGAPGGLKAPG